jgi:hypothetical protein
MVAEPAYRLNNRTHRLRRVLVQYSWVCCTELAESSVAFRKLGSVFVFTDITIEPDRSSPFPKQTILIFGAEPALQSKSSGDEHLQHLEREASVWLVFFLFNITAFTMWYTKCYDSSGTSNPSWTLIFGKSTSF